MLLLVGRHPDMLPFVLVDMHPDMLLFLYPATRSKQQQRCVVLPALVAMSGSGWLPGDMSAPGWWVGELVTADLLI